MILSSTKSQYLNITNELLNLSYRQWKFFRAKKNNTNELNLQ